MIASSVDLSQERLELSSPPHLRRAAADALDRGETHYTTRPGIMPLREQLAGRYQAAVGEAMDAAGQVLITCGLEEALFVALQTLAAAGDEVLVLGPSRADDEAVVSATGATPRHLALPSGREWEGQWLAAAMNERTRVLLLRQPSLDGRSIPSPALAEIVAEAQRADAAVISDEALADFTRPGQERSWFAASPGAAARTVTIGDFSAWGLEGWRVGFLLGPRPLLGPMTNLKQALSICSPALGQYAALAALTGPQEHLVQLRQELASRSSALALALAREGVASPRTEAGYHVFLPSATGSGEEAALTLARAGVRVVAGESQGLPGTVRLTLSQPGEVLAALGARLASGLARQGGAGRGV